MKKLIALALISFSAISVADTKIIGAPLEHLYVPKGFDNNDSIEVVVTGNFPNICYSRNTVKAEVNGDTINVKITSIYSDDMYKWCPPMVIPYSEVVSIGNLQSGNYKIVVNENTKDTLTDDLMVQEANSNAVDDHIYAAVQSIARKDQTKDEFILSTRQYSDCIKLDRVEYVDNGKDTVSILPIMKKVKETCPLKGMNVEYPVKIDLSAMKTTKPLLYIRTLDGKSVSSVVDMGDQR